MDKIQQDINDALETARRLNLLKIIFAAPIFLLMTMLATTLPISLFRMVSEAGYDPAIPLTSMVTQLTSVEKGLIPPDSFFGFLFFLCCGHFTCFYIISKRNRIKAYLMTQIFQLFLLVITYYSWFVAILYLIPLVAVRIVYWIGFVLSLIYLVYILVTKQRASKDYFSSEYYKKFLNVILFLWLLMYGINLFINGLNHFLAYLLLALLPIAPIFLGLFLVSFFKSNLVTLENLNTVNKNQEKYREEYGYTIEEWYGKKSKMYKKHVKKSKKR
ncbi:hypothetical protein [Streptococcus oralis]|uniref:Uncharacterized protein n=1 Tax=Streptococcus oralis SK610 TaxID=1095741 RepID=I0Q3C2_STROR|nr:hypothetical protein [Streptococcus oralis]EIC75774.1 hypothetical protein HMPREF1115_1894 [Streptococcus oralis SK610]